MAVLIPDMEFPESCAKCRFCNFIWLAGQDLCFAFTNAIEDRNNGRPDGCLLKPVSNNADDTLIQELRRYAASYRSGENLGREIEDTDVLLEEAANRLASLASYEKAEADGRLVRLPCSTTQRFYRVEFGRVTEYAFFCFMYNSPEVTCVTLVRTNPKPGIGWVSYPVTDIGKNLFLTRDEAEAALGALKSGEA